MIANHHDPESNIVNTIMNESRDGKGESSDFLSTGKLDSINEDIQKLKMAL
jgi:hypothetical protein